MKSALVRHNFLIISSSDCSEYSQSKTSMKENGYNVNDFKIQTSSDGLVLSRIVAGVWKWGKWGWNFDDQQHLSLIKKCIEYGVTSFDHADIYGGYTSEADFGNALKHDTSLREKIQIVTKCGIKLTTPNRPKNKIKSYNTSKEYIISSVEQSLINFRTDYLDALLIHRPSPLMDADEIAGAVEQLKKDGKILHFGVSNFTPPQFDLLNSRTPLVTNQVELHLMHEQPFLDGTLDQCQQYRIAPMAWSPLTSGRVFRDVDDERVRRINQVAKGLMEKYKAALDQILIAWLIKHPSNIIPILGTGRPDRVLSAVNALSIQLTREEWFELWEASLGHEVP